jgi:hypothetical protein
MATTDWARTVHTTTKMYMKEEENNILRNRKLTAILRDKGRFKFNKGGDKFNWKVRYKRATMQGYADMESLTFPRVNRWKSAELDWRGYSMQDSMSKMERLKNKGSEAIIEVFGQMAQNLRDDFEEHFATEFYVDGDLSSNIKRIHGLESFMGAGAVGTYVAAPSDNFANLSTVLGQYGGGWSGTWPNGSGDDHYDFWSPILVDYQNSAWEAGVKTWSNTCMEAMRFGIIQTQRNKSKRGELDTILMDRDMYNKFLNRLDDKERIQTARNRDNSLLIKLGFGSVTNFDGCDVTWEYGIPQNVGYGLNCDMMEVFSMQKTLIVVDGPVYDIVTKTWRFSLDFFGNCKWNPRHFMKLAAYS